MMSFEEEVPPKPRRQAAKIMKRQRRKYPHLFCLLWGKEIHFYKEERSIPSAFKRLYEPQGQCRYKK